MQCSSYDVWQMSLYWMWRHTTVHIKQQQGKEAKPSMKVHISLCAQGIDVCHASLVGTCWWWCNEIYCWYFCFLPFLLWLFHPNNTLVTSKIIVNQWETVKHTLSWWVDIDLLTVLPLNFPTCQRDDANTTATDGGVAFRPVERDSGETESHRYVTASWHVANDISLVSGHAQRWELRRFGPAAASFWSHQQALQVTSNNSATVESSSVR